MTGNNPIRTIIADDEPLVRQGIHEGLAGHDDVQIVAETRDGLETLQAVSEHAPDLLFLDVQMPELDGFEVVARIEQEPPPVLVFVTAFEQYALRAFQAHAIDYLLKPFDPARLELALEKVRAQIAFRRSGGAPDREPERKLIDSLRASQPARVDRFVVRCAGRFVIVPLEKIQWIEAAGNYVHLHTGEAQYLLRETLSGLLTHLPQDEFVRIHRSTIVRISAIKELERLFAGDFLVRLHDGRELTLSRNHRREFESAIGREL